MNDYEITENYNGVTHVKKKKKSEPLSVRPRLAGWVDNKRYATADAAGKPNDLK